MSAADLELAVAVAEEAGEILRGHWRDRTRLTATHKRAGDFVSEADLAAERHVRARLAAARPEDGWLGEESGTSGPVTRRWIVDPLDGTTNFLRGIPHWAVSVALEVAGEITVGVVHSPLHGETFAARTGAAATLNGAAMTPAATATLEPALFGTGIPFGTMPHIDDHAADIARLMPHCAGVRRMGAAALDLAWVAAGRLDGFWERRLQPWDIAAGLVLLRQSGARVEGWQAAERPEESGTVIAAPPVLFDAFARIIRGE
ncbi:myo-inositol-1(or 4)-monophosphatase [Roseivivax lentus]|uniref:Inositol-1-monophosphatase n=1 Tax=Roseivivax lentus TaxID=633194 RepID=A0A1N7PAQ2_9RHOB|nr:inositol monophosphatase family protein [Roseivivax lentus]SIT07674.1 myo-inositol-1(or 4)-monophosphatase [Roseivivax lentus]